VRNGATSVLAPLASQFGERLVLPGDARYDSARAVWNGMVDKRPAALVRCASAGDVAAVIRYAREAGLPVSVRGGGHQISGAAVVEGGLVIDLSPLRTVDVDAETATRFVFRARPLGKVVVGHRDVPLDAAAGVLAHLGYVVENLPRELAVMARLQRVGGAPALTVEWVWSGGLETADRGVAALGLRADAAAGQVRRFTEVQSRQDHRVPHGALYFTKPAHLAVLGPGQIDALISGAAELPAGDPQIEVLRLGGAVADIDRDTSAFPGRGAAFGVNVAASWTDPADTEEQIRWARWAHATIDAESTGGAYLNFAGTDGPDLELIFGRPTLDRLRQVKRDYDADDLFRPAAHITPS
jgi:hypothetical protein